MGGTQARRNRAAIPMSLEITLTGQLAAEAGGTRADATDLPGRQAPVVFAYLVTERAAGYARLAAAQAPGDHR